MGNTGISRLDDSMQKTNDWLKEVAENLGTGDREKAYQALRAVLHVLRERLTVEEGADLVAQMPLVMKGIFYDGFRPGKGLEKIKTKEEFFQRVEEQSKGFNDIDGALASRAVFRVMEKKISEGEIVDIESILPQDLKDFM